MPVTASRCIGSSAATRTASLRSRCTAGRARRAHLGFELGLLTLLVRLVVRRLAPWWSPVLVLLGFVPIAVNLDLLPLGALVILAGLVPVAGLKVSGEPARVDGWRSRERSRW